MRARTEKNQANGDHVVRDSHIRASNEVQGSVRVKPHIRAESREVRLNLIGELDAAKVIEHMTNLLRPAGYHERIILDFSKTSRISPGELYRLFAELSKCPQFNFVEIRIEGLQFSCDIENFELAENQD